LIKVIYIAGWGRSGSTLIDGILGQVPGLVSVGEIKFIWERGFLQNRRCSCGERFLECPFWTDAIRRGLPGIDQAQVQRLDAASRRTRTRHLPAMLLPGANNRFGKDLDWYRRTIVDLYGGVLEAGQGDVVVDSSKFPSYAFLLHQTGVIDLRVVHLVRDPRAVAFSWRRDKVDPDAPGGERMKKLPSAVTALYWSAWNEAIERISAAQDIPRLVVRYEDLVANPRSTMENLANWTGIGGRPLPFVSDHQVRLGPSHAVSGNAIRFDHGDIRITPDDAWSREMSRRARLAAWASSWPTRRRYGYA
jgi:hypothetical protein